MKIRFCDIPWFVATCFITGAAVTLVLMTLMGVALAREADNEVHTAVTCANTSTEALAVNGGRVSALFVNDSSSTIWIAINQTAVANEGIHLAANGGSYYISDLNGNLDREAVNCIVASGTGIILVTEWFN